MSIDKWRSTNAAGSVNNGAASLDLIAAPGANKVMRIVRAHISITAAATGGGGVVSLRDGTTVIQSWDANAVANIALDYGDIGYPLTANSALNLQVSGAVTTQATAFCTVIAVISQ